jgi:hypothetical protein
MHRERVSAALNQPKHHARIAELRVAVPPPEPVVALHVLPDALDRLEVDALERLTYRCSGLLERGSDGFELCPQLRSGLSQRSRRAVNLNRDLAGRSGGRYVTRHSR